MEGALEGAFGLGLVAEQVGEFLEVFGDVLEGGGGEARVRGGFGEGGIFEINAEGFPAKGVGHFLNKTMLDGVRGLETGDERGLNLEEILGGFAFREEESFAEESPWVMAFWEERDLPSGEIGPRERAPLRRDASI